MVDQDPIPEDDDIDPAAGAGSAGIPRWVKVSLIIAAAIVLLVVILLLIGGDHGPRMHMALGR